MSCLDIQEAPGRQAVGSVQAGRPEAGQAVGVQQPGGSPLQRLETLSARHPGMRQAVSFKTTAASSGAPFRVPLPPKTEQGVTKKKGSREREAASPVVYRRAVFVLY